MDFPVADTLEVTKNMKSPRFIKSHLPIQLLPDQIWTVKPKIIYVKRNCKDSAVSYFHHSALLHGYTGSIEDYMKIFAADYVLYSPFHQHIVDFCLAAKKLDNILVLNFEDMKMDLKSEIRNVAKFLNVEVDDETLEMLRDHLSFKTMKGLLFKLSENLNFCR